MLDRALVLLVFVLSFGALAWHAAPSVGFHDSGEFAMAAASAGITHPPGSPTWTLAASAFLRFFGFQDPARGANLFNALCGAGALALLYETVRRWVGAIDTAGPRWVARAGGVASVLVLLHSEAFIQQSTLAEQYALLALLMTAVLLQATRLHECRRSAVRPRSCRAWCFALGLTWGLAIGNHPTQLSLGLLVVWAVLLSPTPRSRAQRAGDIARMATGLCLGLLVFLWVPFRSRSQPFLDWGNVETLDRFVWAMLRRQWQTRPLADTPPGFVGEWFASYDPAHQLGWVGLALATLGLIVLARRQKLLLGWIFVATVPYAGGLLLAHMRQVGIDVNYVCHYGVSDWHLPIYLVGALAAGIGLGWAVHGLHARARRPAVLAATGLLLLLLSLAGRSVHLHSLRHFHAPTELTRTVLAPLPDHATVLVRSDNLVNLLAYHTYFVPGHRDRWVAYDAPGTAAALAAIPPDTANLPAMWRVPYLTREVMHPDAQPFRIPPLTAEQADSTRLFIEFDTMHPQAHRYLLPRGFLFEVMDTPVHDDDIRLAEAGWAEGGAEAAPIDTSGAHRLEREAWAILHLKRAGYFQARGLWALAEQSYRRALDWQPTHGDAWVALAHAMRMQTTQGEEAKSPSSGRHR